MLCYDSFNDGIIMSLMDIIAEIKMTINLLFKDGVVALDLLLVHLKKEEN